MSAQVKTCAITLPVIKDDSNSVAGKHLAKWMYVPVANNKILTAILDARCNWDKSPVVWVNDCPYRIKVIKADADCVFLWQICLGVHYKRSGKECYHVINKRQVRIDFW